MRVICPGCRKTFEFGPHRAGEVVKCDHCMCSFTIPAVRPSSSPLQGSPVQPSTPGKAGGLVTCPHCSQQLKQNPELAGRIARCPTCRAEFPFPSALGPPKIGEEVIGGLVFGGVIALSILACLGWQALVTVILWFVVFGAVGGGAYLGVIASNAREESRRNILWASCGGCAALALIAWLLIPTPKKEESLSDAERKKQAILRVLKYEKELSKSLNFEAAFQRGVPSEVARLIGTYCARLEALDTSGCPADFRVAYGQHIRACREFQGAIQLLPDGPLEGFFTVAWNFISRGEIDGGLGRLEGELKRVVERGRMAWEEVERIGAKYGAAL